MATDDELREIAATAWVEADRNGDEYPYDAERRALYEAGWDKGYARGRGDSDRAADWLLTDEAVDFWNEQTEDWYQPRKVLKALHDRITKGEK